MTLWSSEVGPYLWHEFDAVRTERELQRIAASGHAAVRTLLPWDAFMPTPRGVDDRRLRAFESFLAIAGRQSLAVVPVLFAQSLGGCIMLPAFAIDVNRKRPGVRVLTDAVVQPGGPRDQYTDQLMLEAALLWLEAVATERERVASQPWPATLDVTSYYANLPESCADLYAEWQRGGSGRPAIFG